MLRKHVYALAASVAVIAIGAPVAWQVGQAPRHQVTDRPVEPKTVKSAAKTAGGEVLVALPRTTELSPPPAPPPAKPATELAPAKPDATSDRLPTRAAREPEAEQAATTGRKGNRMEPPADDGRLAALLDKAPAPRAPAPAQMTSPVATPPKVAQSPPVAMYVPGPHPQASAPATRHLYAPVGKSAMSDTVQQQQALSQEHNRRQLSVPGMVVGHLDQLHRTPVDEGRDRFPEVAQNPIKRVAEEPVSTFSVDVDTASYGIVRRQLNAGRLPQKNAVRIEELVNYFPYDYPLPESKEQPFLPTVTVVPSPWNAGRQLVHIAIKGYALNATERPRANLVFLIDTSGSMGPEDRLPLVRNALRLLVDQLRPEDTIGIVTYAGNARAALTPTRLTEKGKILAAIAELRAGGSTAGAEGLQQAYRMAEAGFDKSAVNRIVLATDGDFNVGITDRRELQSFIERKRETGVFLSILGVGIGNHNDRLMQALAQAGNGVAAYIDTLGEARKVLVEEASSTLFPIAKDVKIQVEFNPATVAEYRLVGYETRGLKREDFNNDKVDAGDVGSGHAVTAIYEITPAGAPATVDALRYAKPVPATQTATAAPEPSARPTMDRELGFLKLRYKRPGEDTSRLIEVAIGRELVKADLASAPTDVRFAIAVAGFGELLKGSAHAGRLTWDEIIALAASAKGPDPFGYRAELINLVRLAKSANP